MRVAPVAVDVLGREDVHEQRDEGDDHQHHDDHAVDLGADRDRRVAGLEPGCAVDDRAGEVLFPALFGGWRSRCGHLAGWGEGLFTGTVAGAGRGSFCPVQFGDGGGAGRIDVGQRRHLVGCGVTGDPLAGGDQRQGKTDADCGDADGMAFAGRALSEEQDDGEAERHDGREQPNLVEHDGRDHPITPSTRRVRPAQRWPCCGRSASRWPGRRQPRRRQRR